MISAVSGLEFVEVEETETVHADIHFGFSSSGSMGANAWAYPPGAFDYISSWYNDDGEGDVWFRPGLCFYLKINGLEFSWTL